MKGKFALPGLINSHEHLATPPDRRFAEAMMRRDIYSGVTAVRAMGDDARAVAEFARAARSVKCPVPTSSTRRSLPGRIFFMTRVSSPPVRASSRARRPGCRRSMIAPTSRPPSPWPRERARSGSRSTRTSPPTRRQDRRRSASPRHARLGARHGFPRHSAGGHRREAGHRLARRLPGLPGA